MQHKTSNPLSGYFRQPAIYLTLPSQGRWWPIDSLDMPDNNELPIFPMTARDEVIIRTPDALLNGQGVVDVVQSCCPNIKNAWQMPSIDIDAVLISIRIATYGPLMSFSSQCPYCKSNNTHEIDLGKPLESIKCPDFDQTLGYQDLKIKLKPQYYLEVNKTNMVSYEEQKIIQTLNNENIDNDTRLAQVTLAMQKIIDIGINNCVNSVDYIEMPNGDRVIEKQHIKEFFQNAEKQAVTIVQERIEQIANDAKMTELQLSCESCQEHYQTELTFDYANFFAKGF